MTTFVFGADPIYTLRINSGETFTIEKSKLKISNVLYEMTEGDESGGCEIPVLKGDKDTMDKIVKFMNHYITEPMNEVPKPVPQNAKVSDIVQTYYIEFIFGDSNDLTPEQERMMYNLFIISNYLDIKPLFALCCLKTAVMMRNADREKLARMFNSEPEPVVVPTHDPNAMCCGVHDLHVPKNTGGAGKGAGASDA